jgi:A/G-specific adenine glycosylase
MKYESCLKVLSAIRESSAARLRLTAVREDDLRRFRKAVRGFYRSCGRDFAWRKTRDPYRVLVSEIMLQQTQTQRVAERFPLFLQAFPNLRALARAPQSDVIRAWEGLGYYRRARNLHRAAQAVVELHGGRIPESYDALRALPGVGAYTAAAVSAFAFDRGVAMIETNIRSVYLYVFFRESRAVSDREILELVAATMPAKNVREWFYALMDLGVELKKQAPRINHASRHHKAQTPFKGSDRRVAAQVLRYIVTSARPVSKAALAKEIRRSIEDVSSDQIERALVRLEREALIVRGTRGLFGAK